MDSKNELVFDMGKSSGYLAYDEQFITIGKDSVPKAQIIDILNNQTIAIRILNNVTSEEVEEFIRAHTTEENRICLVTDHDHAYHSVVINLKFEKTQQCLFHFIKIIDRKVNDIIKKNKPTDDEVKKLKEYGNRIKSIFLVDDIKDFIYRLNRFFKLWDDVPEDLKKYYNKKIVRDMHKLTQHLFDPNVPKTNNILESKFSGAQQKSLKLDLKQLKDV